MKQISIAAIGPVTKHFMLDVPDDIPLDEIRTLAFKRIEEEEGFIFDQIVDSMSITVFWKSPERRTEGPCTNCGTMTRIKGSQFGQSFYNCNGPDCIPF